MTKNISEEQFDNGYLYVDEIKAFAKELGIVNSARLRKDELEALIKNYLRTGEVGTARRKNIIKRGIKDCEFSLELSLIISNYTNKKETWDSLLWHAAVMFSSCRHSLSLIKANETGFNLLQIGRAKKCLWRTCRISTA